MKIIPIILISISTFLQVPKSNYKPGFKYYDQQGSLVTLLKWTKVSTNLYRWKAKYQFAGITGEYWTDDVVIDIATGKAYFNKELNKPVYYSKEYLDKLPASNYNPIKP